MSEKFEKQHKRRINSMVALLADITIQLKQQQLWNKMSPSVRSMIEKHIKEWDAYQSHIRNRRYKAQLARIDANLNPKKKKVK